MSQHKLSLARGVLIDTSAYFAFADRDDKNRSAAQTIFTDLANRGVHVFTTDLHF